jgi:hypothetical protein
VQAPNQAPEPAESTGPDTDNVQQGDQSGPNDTADTGTEKADPADGPGDAADSAGAPESGSAADGQ